MLASLRNADRFDRADAPSRRQEVRKQLQRLLQHCASHSRFYRRDGELISSLLTETDDDRFFSRYRELTPLTKQDLATHFDEIVTDAELTLERIRAFDAQHADGLGLLRTARGPHQAIKTSGTSGEVVYIADQVTNIRQVMSLVFFRSLIRVVLQAGLWPVLLPLCRPFFHLLRGHRRSAGRATPRAAGFKPSWSERLWRFFKPSVLVFVHRGNRSVYRGTTSHSQPLWVRLLLHMRVLSHQESLTSILAQAQWMQPEFMFGLPSRIEWLARAQLAGDLEIHPLAVYVGGETLHAELLDLFRSAWPNALVVNTYGATETKVIALACPECNELHVCEDIVYLELLDESGRPTPAGERASQVYATSLRNEVVPVLRYEMSDNIVPLPDAGCRWKTRRIRVQGREPAFLWVRHQRTGQWVPLNGRMLKERLVGLPGALGFAVRHSEPSRLELSIVTRNPSGPAASHLERAGRDALHELAREQGSALSDLLPDVVVKIFDAEDWNREGGKLNSISSSVLPPNLEAAPSPARAQA